MMVVYRIVESMGGTIQIASEVNKGTQVSLYLPLAQSLHIPPVEQNRNIFVALQDESRIGKVIPNIPYFTKNKQ
jgi:two-component system, sporulation sensor kinase B